MAERVPEIWFSCTRNQPKTEFKASRTRLFFIFCHIWWSQHALNFKKSIKYGNRFRKKMKKSHVKLVFSKTYFSIELPKLGFGYLIHHYCTSIMYHCTIRTLKSAKIYSFCLFYIPKWSWNLLWWPYLSYTCWEKQTKKCKQTADMKIRVAQNHRVFCQSMFDFLISNSFEKLRIFAWKSF